MAGQLKVGLRDLDRRAPPGLVWIAKLHTPACKSIVPALAIGVSRFEVDGLRKEVDINAFLDGLVNFFADGRHFLASSPVDDTDAFGSQAQGRTGSVHRCVATPNHDDVFAVNAHATLMHVVKEIDSLFHGVRAMNSKLQFALQLL